MRPKQCGNSRARSGADYRRIAAGRSTFHRVQGPNVVMFLAAFASRSTTVGRPPWPSEVIFAGPSPHTHQCSCPCRTFAPVHVANRDESAGQTGQAFVLALSEPSQTIGVAEMPASKCDHGSVLSGTAARIYRCVLPTNQVPQSVRLNERPSAKKNAMRR